MSDHTTPPGAHQPPTGWGTPPPPPQFDPNIGYSASPVPYAGAALTLPPGVTLASHGRRIGAYFLSIPLAIVTLGIGYLIWGAIVWSKGTSPALQVLGMKAYVPAQQRVGTWGTMATRNILDYLVGMISCGISHLVSFVLFLTDDRHRTLADRIGSTVIVHDPTNQLG